MKKKELLELLESPDFSAPKETAVGGPYSIKGSSYRGRSDIYIREMFGNYFLDIDPMYSGLKYYGNLEDYKCSKDLWIETAKDPEKYSLSVEEVYQRIEKYLDALEEERKLEIELLVEMEENIKKLRPDYK